MLCPGTHWRRRAKSARSKLFKLCRFGVKQWTNIGRSPEEARGSRLWVIPVISLLIDKVWRALHENRGKPTVFIIYIVTRISQDACRICETVRILESESKSPTPLTCCTRRSSSAIPGTHRYQKLFSCMLACTVRVSVVCIFVDLVFNPQPVRDRGPRSMLCPDLRSVLPLTWRHGTWNLVTIWHIPNIRKE
jgi:hypothetical protein